MRVTYAIQQTVCTCVLYQMTAHLTDCKNYQKDADCDYWASIGECVLNPGWMLYKCTKSCRLCGDSE